MIAGSWQLKVAMLDLLAACQFAMVMLRVHLSFPLFCTYIVVVFVSPMVRSPQSTEVTGLVRVASQYTPKGAAIKAADTFKEGRSENRARVDTINIRTIAKIMIKRSLTFNA